MLCRIYTGVMRLKTILLVMAMLVYVGVSAQTKTYNIRGIVTDEKGKGIDFATISLNGDLGTNSEVNGHYTIKNVPKGTYVYRVSYVGYQTHTDTINVNADLTINVKMRAISLELKDVVVTANQVSGE